MMIELAIAEAYTMLGQGWQHMADVARLAGLTSKQMAEGVLSLHEAGELLVDQHALRHRGSDGDYRVMLGGEFLNIIKWTN